MTTDLVTAAFHAVRQGIALTIAITLASFLLGQLAALPIALALTSRRRWLRRTASSYTFLMRGSPLLVQLFIVYYGLAQVEAVRHSLLWLLLRDPVQCAILTIGLNSAAYAAELLAGALRDLPRGQKEAAEALGLSPRLALLTIVLPQVYRAVLPAISNEIVLVMKGSTLASTVTVMEITGMTRSFVARTYAPFEVVLVAGAVYLTFGLILTRMFRSLERRLALPVQ